MNFKIIKARSIRLKFSYWNFSTINGSISNQQKPLPKWPFAARVPLTFEIRGQIENRPRPFADQPTSSLLVLLALFRVFVEVHDSLANTRVF